MRRGYPCSYRGVKQHSNQDKDASFCDFEMVSGVVGLVVKELRACLSDFVARGATRVIKNDIWESQKVSGPAMRPLNSSILSLRTT